MALTGEAKKAYQKDLMRKRREAIKAAGKAVSRPSEATGEEWKDAEVRAERAKVYAEKLPEHVSVSEKRFANAEWQWWNEYRGEDRMEYAPEPVPVVLEKRRCEKCAGTWSSSVPMECPYCHGKGRKSA